MKIQYGLFDSATGDDRVYRADEMAVVFRALASSGVKNMADCLKITAAGSGMKVNMAPGSAMVNGYIMTAIDDGGGVYALTLLTGGTMPRIDRIVIRLDLSTDARTVVPTIKQGTPQGNPVPPALTRSGEVYEISLAQVYVAAGATIITNQNITDERANESVCGAIMPEALKLSTLAATHVHDAATASASGLMTASHVMKLDSHGDSISAQGTRLGAAEGKITTLQTDSAALKTGVAANAAQLVTLNATLSASSTPTFKGANLTGTLNMNGNYIDNALFR